MSDDKIVGLTMEQFHKRREMCKELIARNDALTRLENNADFKLLIMEGYLEEEAVRLVHLLGEQTFNMATSGKDGKATKADYREDFQERMIGIARLAEYFRSVYQLANQAQNELGNLAEAEAQYFSSNSETIQ